MDRPHMSRVSETATLPFYEGAFVQASPEIERIRKDAGLDEEELSATGTMRRAAGTGVDSRHRR